LLHRETRFSAGARPLLAHNAAMTDETEALYDALSEIMPPLLTALETLSFFGRKLHPPHLPQLLKEMGDMDAPLRPALEKFQTIEWPSHLEGFKHCIVAASESVCSAYEGLRESVGDPNGVLKAYRALRHNSRATELLYPVSNMLPIVSRFFLETDRRGDDDLVKKLADAAYGRDHVGVMHANNDKGSRGGFSIYVPEYYDENIAYPVIVAMHGGSGHGRGFLWTWLREARTRGAILISPSSRGDTWALMGPDIDSENIEAMVNYAAEHWNVDRSKLLLTGMSDGGTFSYVSGLRAESPFTHLAPFSASFHPLLLDAMDPERIKGLPIYLSHGALDWMFPIDIARTANQALMTVGAEVIYREINDLSHTYPSEENPKIMDWFLESR
jgi:phospholipase/carboxylesterase